MSIFRKCFSILPVISVAIATTVTAKTQCVSVSIPKFNLIPDSNCSISYSELVQSAAPDQVFLYELGLAEAEESCFIIFNSLSGTSVVNGIISDQESGNELAVKVSGVAGLTINTYPNYGYGPTGALSFTASTLVSITTDDNKDLGTLVTRDAGTIFSDGSAAARLSVIQGQGTLKRTTGYIDEAGYEFDYSNPAMATGTLCGKQLADSLFRENQQ